MEETKEESNTTNAQQVSAYLKPEVFEKVKQIERDVGISRQVIISEGLKRVTEEFSTTGKISLNSK
tara:strand:- start:54 stop:251 length:198 start_codon:yes stop_codon:yes gene_type:complete